MLRESRIVLDGRGLAMGGLYRGIQISEQLEANFHSAEVWEIFGMRTTLHYCRSCLQFDQTRYRDLGSSGFQAWHLHSPR